MYLSNCRFDFSNQGYNGTLHTCKRGCFFQNQLILMLESETWLSKKLKKCYKHWFISIFKLTFSRTNWLHFLHWNVNRKLWTCKKVIDWKNVHFYTCIKRLTVPILLKVPWILIILELLDISCFVKIHENLDSIFCTCRRGFDYYKTVFFWNEF